MGTSGIDGIAAMASVAGLTRESIQQLWQDAQDNQRRLAACSSHFFVRDLYDPKRAARYRCTHCRGQVDGHAYRWYMLGRAHGTQPLAGGLPVDDVVPPSGS